MKTIKNLQAILKHTYLDEESNRIDSDETFHWGAKIKKQYDIAAKQIDAISYTGNGWAIYGWYDVSGFNYWMQNMRESNYIQITLALDSGEIEDEEFDEIVKCFDNALADADAITNQFDYLPEMTVLTH